MPRVRFLRDFDWKPSQQVTLAFKGGRTYLVTSRCAELALRKGAAEAVTLRPPTVGVAAKIRRQTRRKADGQ